MTAHNQSSDTTGESPDRQTGRGGARAGLPGKLRLARQAAPEHTDDDVAVAVGRRAWREDRDPADIWREIDESGRREAPGANHKCPKCDGFLAATEYDDVYRCDNCGRLCYEVTA